MTEERLQKVIANAGITSRRKAEVLITEGHIKVNGKRVTQLGTKVSSKDEVAVDGVPIESEKLAYYLFYKPRGVISAASDDKGRKVVTDYFESIPQRLYPVGRLDYDTSGLLIMTNDGEFANLLMHPRYEIEKTYVAKVENIPTLQAQLQLRKGIYLGKRKTARSRVNVISSDKRKNTAIVRLTIHEGMNHQVKNMFKAVGSNVIKLSRESLGFLNLEGLISGQYRALTHQEIDLLKQQAKGKR